MVAYCSTTIFRKSRCFTRSSIFAVVCKSLHRPSPARLSPSRLSLPTSSTTSLDQQRLIFAGKQLEDDVAAPPPTTIPTFNPVLRIRGDMQIFDKTLISKTISLTKLSRPTQPSTPRPRSRIWRAHDQQRLIFAGKWQMGKWAHPFGPAIH